QLVSHRNSAPAEEDLMSIPPIEKFVGFIPVYPNKSAPEQWAFAQALSNSTAAAGLNSIRIAFFWNYLTPDNYQYNCANIVMVTTEARRKGFRIWAIINPPNNPNEVGWTPPSINSDVKATFLKLISNMAYAYGDIIESWEILNEANQ